MKVIPPKTIDLSSSTVAASSLDEWNVATGYSIGNQVKDTRTTPHYEYESLTDSNTGNDPVTSTTNWAVLGATNRWKMFDDLVASQTENADSIIVEVDSGRCDSLALFGLDATEVTVELTYDSVVISTVTYDLDLDPSTSWSDYFFEDFFFREDFFTAFPIYTLTSSLKVTITNTGSTAKCGLMVIGRGTYLGQSQFGVTVGILSFSKKETNEFGQTYLAQGRHAKRMDIDITVRAGSVDIVHAGLTALDGLPAVWQGNNDLTDYQSMLIYGFFREFSTTIPGPIMSSCTLEIEGLI